LNGGSILAYSSNPTIPAVVVFNPPGGVITGTLDVTAAAGVFKYLDLSIKLRGPDYIMRFSASPTSAQRTITTTQTIFVSFSNEFELRPVEAQQYDLIGHSVSLDGDIAVMGAPASNRSVTCIQTVTTTGLNVAPRPAVQIVSTHIEPQPEIQRFHTTADVGGVVGGTFSISYQLLGPTRPIPVNVDPSMLQAILFEDIPALGNVTVSREAYIFCACENAFTWTLTFNDLNLGPVDALTLSGKGLHGFNSKLSEIITIQDSAVIGGSFTLLALGQESEPLSYDASVNDIEMAIASLGFPAIAINAWPLDLSRQKHWQITFAATRQRGGGLAYETPLLSSNAKSLTGGNTSIWHKTLTEGLHGPSGIAGGFYLEWRGNTTTFLPYNISAANLKAELEKLPVIGLVNVNRSMPTSISGYTWTIEFVEVLYNSPRGYFVERISNLEPLIAKNFLSGTNASVTIGSRYDFGGSNNIYGAERIGTFGVNAGATYVFQKSGEKWDQVSTLFGNDTRENHRFGSSVAVKGDLIVIGALGADMNGVQEKQSIFCSASSGHFTLMFRGWQSDPIRFDVGRQEFIDAIIANPEYFGKLYTVNAILVDDWGTGGLCQNNTATITFLSPVNGALNLFPTDEGAHLELLTVNILDLKSGDASGIVKVTETQRGTEHVDGANADLQQVGSVYVFRLGVACATNATLCVKNKWVQEAQLFPYLSSGGAQFGTSVATTGSLIVVGSPGDNAGKGSVSIFEASTSASGIVTWNMLQKLSIATALPNDNFGYSVAVEEQTILVGAPNMFGTTGAVFAYKRARAGLFFSLAQTPKPDLLQYPLQVGDNYGSCLSISGDIMIVGAPAHKASTIYLGRTQNPPEEQTGAVFVFKRITSDYDFLPLQSLLPTNIRRLDRFGTSVDIDGSSIIVGALESYAGNLTASKAIIQVITKGAYNALPIGTSFKLKWRMAKETGEWEMRTTRDIPYDTTALQMAAILEQDLLTGAVLVSRSSVDIYDNGYSWLITFVDQISNVDILVADSTSLTGTDATVEVSFVNPSPPSLRGKAHLFVLTDGLYIEEAYLSPFSHQPIDRCAGSVAISGNYALVGCPNRDSSVPNHNSGATTAYYLDLLHVAFSSYQYRVSEAKDFTMILYREASTSASVDILFYIETLDRNAGLLNQQFLKDLFGVTDSDIPYPLTINDVLGISGTAIGRSQYYGSTHNESKWVDGMYDYRAISDYVPIYHPRVFLTEYTSINDTIFIADDTIFETPDENVTIAIHSPGIWPSILGHLMAILTIVDNGDGYVMGSNGNASSQYEKLYQRDAVSGNSLGYALSVNDLFGVMASGLPLGYLTVTTAAGSTTTQPGAVVVYRQNFGSYVEQLTLYSPTPVEGARFGDDVIVKKGFLSSELFLVVGEPVQANVYVYISNDQGVTFALEATLNTPLASLERDRFGSRGTLGLDGHLLCVGAPGFEAIFAFMRVYVNDAWVWSEAILLRSSDFDYDIIYTVVHLHRMEFGTSVAVSGRSVAVGAPFADYDKLGTNLVEIDWDTEGTDIVGYGRGKAYMFYSTPYEQVITLTATNQLSIGTFQLAYSHFGFNLTTTQLHFSSSPDDLASSLMALANIDQVSVTSAAGPLAAGGYIYSWTITFLSDWQAPALIVPQWFNHSCDVCIDFDAGTDAHMHASLTKSMGAMRQQQAVKASDGKNGNRFGFSIALDGDQVAVGAIYSGSTTTTTWDFEAGTLAGWGSTGNAFQFQPTWGDNSYMRPVDPGGLHSLRISPNGQTSALRGFYYIGTFEMRPGSSFDYSVPDPAYPQGTYQGDEPQGTLTSQVFIIYGSTISFLIGGGCDIYNVYVELLVDGLSVSKFTGKCDEKMEEVSFDVRLFQSRAAQIRIVDASSSNWGHINVDEFKFDWDVNGATFANTNLKSFAGGVLETPHSGIVYTFLRHAYGSNNLCVGDKSVCVWTEEAKLTASDKRANQNFGYSVAVNDAAGVVIVGSPNAGLTGFYKETPRVYPYTNSTGQSDASGLLFPVPARDADLFQSAPTLTSEHSGAAGVWYLLDPANFNSDSRAYEQSGAVYVFSKDHAVVAGTGQVTIPQHWPYTEHAKIQPPDAFARDHFGACVSFDGSAIAVGSTGNDGKQPDAGAVYMYKAGIAGIQFASVRFRLMHASRMSVCFKCV